MRTRIFLALVFGTVPFAVATAGGCGGVLGSSDGSPDAFQVIEAAVQDASIDADAACASDAGCAVQVSSGHRIACALWSDGSVWCWGASQFAGLGRMPSATDRFGFPLSEHYVASAERVASLQAPVVNLSVGDEFVCAVDAAGEAWCWGANGFAQLGHDPSSDGVCAFADGGAAQACDPTPTTPADLPSDVVEIAAGDDVVCARTSSGHVYCWGSNESGVAGQDPASTGLVVGAQEVTPSGLSGHASSIVLAHGAHAACAIHEDTSVWCWGDDLHGRLGRTYGSLDACDGGCTGTPTPILEGDGGLMHGAMKVAVGSSSVCAQTASNIRCWGGNGVGGLAIGSWDESDHPSPVTSNVPSGTTSLAGSGDAYFVHDAFGGTLVWGINSHAELGVGDLDGGGATNGQPCGAWRRTRAGRHLGRTPSSIRCVSP